GKELVALAIHKMSPVSQQRFAICNCSALVDTLLESTLFGHIRGAFTGAMDTRPGLFEYATGGTVFLDEVGETSLQMQSKLLRVIQNREIQRVGSPEVRRVDVRLIAATNRDLRTEVLAGRFREDLFYRLSTIQINVPNLMERLEDIPMLVQFFLKKYNQAYGKQCMGLTRRAQTVLLQHSWPGMSESWRMSFPEPQFDPLECSLMWTTCRSSSANAPCGRTQAEKNGGHCRLRR
ncbi:MAG TPA: sigma 54-interacting transcriptional regulator, partial [Candidatus Limnocylindrales bacterium]|nr:sigma 54-interacting transcriptional regulator [Candidatus Limnocylindrales bacterium]